MACNICINTPANCGETALFAASELRDFLGKLNLTCDVTVDFKLDNSMKRDAYTATGCGAYTITAGAETGMLYGAYGLLNAFGIEFFSPDEFDTLIPREPVAPMAVDLAVTPRFDLRGFFAVEKRDSEAFLLWMARNGLNYWTSESHHPELCRKLGMQLRANSPRGTHHLFEDYLPPARYFAEHPEFYGLINGKRDCRMAPGDSTNICTTNSEGIKTLVDNIIADLQAGGRLERASALSFAPFDNGRWCECENCTSSGNRTARLLKLADYCSKRIRKEVPRTVKLIVSAYHETLLPPDVDLGDDFDYENIMIEFFPIERCYTHAFDDENCPGNAQLKKYLEAWLARGDFRTFICEYYNVSAFASVGLPMDEFMENDLKYYADNGAVAIAYMHVSTALWAQQSLTNCAYAAAANGKKFDAAEFLQKRFGKYADQFAPIYDILRRIAAVSKPLLHYQGTGELKSDQSNTIKYMLLVELRKAHAGQPYNFYYPGHFEKTCDNGKGISLQTVLNLLDECEKLVNALPAEVPCPKMQARIECEKMRFFYTADRIRVTADLMKLFEAESANNTAEAQTLAEAIFVRGERMRQDKIGPAHIRSIGAPNYFMYFNAMCATRFQQIYADKMVQYGKPLAPFAPEERVEIKQG